MTSLVGVAWEDSLFRKNIPAPPHLHTRFSGPPCQGMLQPSKPQPEALAAAEQSLFGHDMPAWHSGGLEAVATVGSGQLQTP